MNLERLILPLRDTFVLTERGVSPLCHSTPAVSWQGTVIKVQLVGAMLFTFVLKNSLNSECQPFQILGERVGTRSAIPNFIFRLIPLEWRR